MNNNKHGIAKFFRNADASWTVCILGLIGGFVLSNIGFILCNGAGFNEIYKDGDTVLRNYILWIGIGLNFVFNVVFYLSLTCIVSKINPPVRRHGGFMRLLAILSMVIVCFGYIAFHRICAELFDGSDRVSLWYFLFLYEYCRGIWRWIVGVRVSVSMHEGEKQMAIDNVSLLASASGKEVANAKNNSCFVFLCIGVVIGIAIGVMLKMDGINWNGMTNIIERLQRQKSTYSKKEMLSHFKNGTDYTIDEINAMTDEQYAEYCRIAEEKKLEIRTENARELKMKAEFCVKQLEGNSSFKDYYEEVKYAVDFFENHLSLFINMDDDKIKLWNNQINMIYDAALRHRGRKQKIK